MLAFSSWRRVVLCAIFLLSTAAFGQNVDLRINSVSDAPADITLGQGDITYTIPTYNGSATAGTGVVFTANLPASSTYVSHTIAAPGATCTPSGGVLTCNWPTHNAFTQYIVGVTVTPGVGGTNTLTANISGAETDPAPANNTASENTNVNATINLAMYSVSDSPTDITLGQGNVVYSIQTFNYSSSAATNPVLTITLPASSTYVSHTVANGGSCTPSGGVLTCTWPVQNASALFASSVTVTPGVGGTNTLNTSIASDQGDSTPGNNTMAEGTTVNATIDLAMYSVSDSPTDITLGQGNVVYSIQTYNYSSSKATNPVLTITLPASSTYVSHTVANGGSCTPSGGVLTCTWPVQNATTLFASSVTVTPGVGGTNTLNTSIAADQGDPTPGNNTMAESTTVNATIDLAIYSLSDSPAVVTLGQGNVVYSVQTYNYSSSKATNPTLTLTLPASSTYVSHAVANGGSCTPSGSVLTCTWPFQNASTLFASSVTVTPGAGGTNTLNASIAADQGDGTLSNNTQSESTTVNATIDLQLTITDSPDPRVLGAGNVTYSASIYNAASSKATNPALTFTLPATVTFSSAAASAPGSCVQSSGTVTCTWADINAGTSRTASIVVSPTVAGQISANGSVSATQGDPNSANNSVTVTTNINPGSAPTITSFSPTSGPIGTVVTITGSSLFSASSVKFNGVSATLYTVNNDGSITATVPSTGTTGVISVTNSVGTSSSSGVFTVTAKPDLTIGKTASPTSVPYNGAITYTISVSNSGAGATHNVTVVDTLPTGVTVTSNGTDANWTCSGTTTLTCTLNAGPLAAASSAPPLVIGVNAPASGTTLFNTANVSTTTPETSTTNNSGGASVTVTGCPVTPAISGPTLVCANLTGNTSQIDPVPSATYAWTITNGTIVGSNTSNVVTWDASTADPITLGVSVFVTGCTTATNSVNINVSNVSATITPSGPTTFCPGGSVTLTANAGASWLWSTLETTQSITVTANGSYDVEVTNASGCSVISAPTNVTVNPAATTPTVSAGGLTTFCAGGSVTLISSESVGNQWKLDGTPISGATGQNHVAFFTGNYTVVYTNGSGCSTESVPLAVSATTPPAAPTISASGPTTFCTGGSVTLTSSAASGNQWKKDNAVLSGQTGTSFVATVAGDYTVVVTDGNGCSAESSPTTVQVNTPPLAPSITASGPTTFCAGGSVTLNSSSATGNQWKKDGILLSGQTAQTLAATATGNYTVVFTDGSGCSSESAAESVLVNPAPPAPTITPSGPTTFCTGGSVTLASSSLTGNQWQLNGVNIVAANANDDTYLVNTSGSYTVVLTNGNGCSAVSAPIVVQVNAIPPAPTITASGPTTFCNGGSVTLTSSSAANYQWKVDGTNITGATTGNLVVTTPGSYTVMTTTSGCSSESAPAVVQVNPVATVPTISAAGPTTFCSGGSVTLTSSAASGNQWKLDGTPMAGQTGTSLVASVSGNYTVLFTDGSGCQAESSPTIVQATPLPPAPSITASGPPTFCAGGSVTLASSSPTDNQWKLNGANLPGEINSTLMVSASGSYTVVVTDASGCSSESTPIVVQVNPTPPTPAITAGGPTTFCAGGSVTLTATAASSWLWSNGANTQSITVNASGNYSVTIADGNGCYATSSPTTVTVNPLPAATITPDGPTTFCTGGQVTLTASAGASWLWSTGATTQSIVVSTSGSHTVTVTDNGCSTASATTTVTVTPNPVVVITGATASCASAPVLLDAGPGFSSYAWSTGATSQQITVSPANSANYTVTVTSGGCTATDSHAITVTPSPSTTISAPSSACQDTSGHLASVTPQTGVTFVWTITNGTITAGQGTDSITFSVGSAAQAVLGLTATSGGCSVSSNRSVPIVPPPSIVISAPAAAANGASLIATVQSHPTATYLWTISNGTIDAGQGTTDIAFTTGTTGTSTTLSILVGAGGCSSTDTATITLDPIGPSCETQPPSLLAPAALVTTQSPVLFQWTSVINAASYELWVNGTLAATTAGTSFTLALPSGPVSWFVIANLGGGCSPLTSATRSFTIAQTVECAQNARPLITAPVTGATLGSPVTISWSSVPQAVGYRVSIAVNGAPAEEIGATNGATSLIAAVPPGAIVAFVDAVFSGCPSTRSDGVAFTIPTLDPCATRATANPVAPANNTTVNSSSVDFGWSSAIGAIGYRLWASIQGGIPVVLGETTSTTLPSFIDSGVVVWWTEALYEGCASTESQRFRFTIPARTNCGVESPVVISPANGVSAGNEEVAFTWTSVPSAVGYEVYLSVADGTPSLIGTTTGATTLTRTVPAGTLEWFVRALVDRCPSRDSQTARFTFVQPAACAARQRPVTIEPLGDATSTSPVSFGWSAPPGATRYELFVTRGQTPPSLLRSTTSPRAESVALANGRLSWFVRAFFGPNCAPMDSAEHELLIVPTPAACTSLEPPVLSAPGQISTGAPLRIQWSPVAGATTYQLQIANNSSFAGAQTIDTNATQHPFTPSNDGTTEQTIHARVRAIDARCATANVSPFGPSALIYVLPRTGDDGSTTLTDPTPITFTFVLGPEYAGQTFTAIAKHSWLTVTPSSGIVAPQGTTLTVVANTSGLPVGTSLGAISITLSSASVGNVATHGTTTVTPNFSVSLVTPVTPSPGDTPPPDALIIPAVAHADGINSHFQSDVRVSNTSPRLITYRVSFTPSGESGITQGQQTNFSIEPGRTIALDDVLKSWFGTGNGSAIGTLEIRPLTETATSTSSAAFNGLANLATFASSRTFNTTANGTFGQYIPAVPFANFIGRAAAGDVRRVLSLQQIAQSSQFRTNLGLVEGSGEPASLVVRVFGSSGEYLTEFPVNLRGGQHLQLNSFLRDQGLDNLSDGRVEVEVLSDGGKVTAYASVLDNATNDPLLVTPVSIADSGARKWVVPGVADLASGFANWQTDMRLFNAGTETVDATLLFYSQGGGEPKTATITLPAGQVRQFDRALSSLFQTTNDGGAVHITTAGATKLITTARTYNQTSAGTYGQFISGVTEAESAGIESRPLQLLQVEESDRFRSNIGLVEVSGKPVTLELSITPPDAKFTAVTEVPLRANEFRQLGSLLASVGLDDTHNARVTVRVIHGDGRVTAYASVIDMQTNDPTYVPAQ